MDQGGDRGRAFHRVGQPGMQPDLRRFAHGADEQQDAQRVHRVEMHAEERDRRPDLAWHGGEDGVEHHRVEHQEGAHDAQREAEIADPVDHERLDRGGVGRGPVEPESDQQIGAQPDALPAEEQLDEIVGRHQHQHAEGEEIEIAEEARDRLVVVHVADGVDVDHRRDDVDHHQHDGGQLVDAQRPVGLEAAGLDPAEQRGGADMAVDRDVEEHHDRQHRRRRHQRAGDQLRRGVAEAAPEQPGDDRAEQRQEYDGDVHAAAPSPSSY